MIMNGNATGPSGGDDGKSLATVAFRPWMMGHVGAVCSRGEAALIAISVFCVCSLAAFAVSKGRDVELDLVTGRVTLRGPGATERG